ncbi:LLM class flavin-dependent oxidoreductase [Rhodococcus pyridinivorans]|uniref:LLM class flavin-dependent oxidoreductase n=1 Tax=Rhodococcus pyridinivorans TaxID=103816 RepID=UPI0020786A68|nr:LLM class flavin-dependent oxidoreductase [Rhodococcus pyridinivorans]
MLIGSVGNHQGAWRRPTSRVEESNDLSLFADIAQAAERAKIHTLFIADGLTLDRDQVRTKPFAGLEPITLLSALAAVTEKIGFVASVSTTFSEPYNVARQLASLDHISRGRAAWNIVTSAWGEINFGGKPLPSHSERYRIADEYVRAILALWDSWEPGSVVNDRAAGIFADPEKIHPIDFVGEHFTIAGPLNVPRSPQGRPVIAQAGSSSDGKAFAAKYAEIVFTAQQSLTESQAFYRDLREHVAAVGRNPDDVKILPGVSPILGRTEKEAIELHRELVNLIDVESGLVRLSRQLGHVDLSDLDVDGTIPAERLPDIEQVQGRQSRYGVFKQLALEEKFTIRQLIEMEVSSSGHWVPVGSVEQIADQLEERFQQGGADGFILLPSFYPEGFTYLTDELVPLLQERGLFQEEYSGDTLRERLRLPQPSPVTPLQRS